MSDKRTEFGRAAYRVVGTSGLRALTHRAVDDLLGVASGSVNYYAPTRVRLQQLALAAAYDDTRVIAVREFTPLLTSAGVPSPALVVDCTVRYILAMTTEGRTVSNARTALLLEAQFDETLSQMIVERRTEFIALADVVTRRTRPDRDERDTELVVALIDGLIQQQSLNSSSPFPEEMIRVGVTRAFGFSATDVAPMC